MEKELICSKKGDLWSIYMVNGSLHFNVVDWIADGFRIPRDVLREIIEECNGFIFTIDKVLPLETNRFNTEEDALKAIEMIKAAVVMYKLI